ncbi:serine/threonine-protein kinase [Herbidospora mongoliensis]|uniref:serine/threonine-protein kinase n=1 Tax=Herbidospora mongoliensis TaxID=688067 RepID=UPI000AAE66A9|nr:serine/threonine-protein kinase [Herbidospora mongoliensis]
MEGTRRLAGRYQLQERIGRGGMGVVWRAHDELLDRAVAVKEIHYTALSDEDRADFNRRTIREARAAGRLSHPNVIVVHDVIEEDGRPWIVMQLVRSTSLGDALREHGPLVPDRVATIGAQVLDALMTAHASGVLHRDVKPENVLLSPDNRVVLTDFGIASMTEDPSMTLTGTVTGTPAFLPPERLAGHPATPESDLWSLGATLWAAVEGRSPYDRGTPIASMAAVLHEEIPIARRAGALAPVLEGLMCKDPTRRMGAEQAMDLLHQAASAKWSPQGGGRPSSAGANAGASTRHDAGYQQHGTGFTGQNRPHDSFAGQAAPQGGYGSPTGPGHYPGGPSGPGGGQTGAGAGGYQGHTPPDPYGAPTGQAGPGGYGPPHHWPTLAPPERDRDKFLITTLVTLLVVLVGIGGYFAYTTLGSPDDTGPIVSGVDPATEVPTPRASAEPTPEPTPTVRASDAPVLPRGWTMYEDQELRFAVALPPGWEPSKREGQRVFFRGPGMPGYLQIDLTPWEVDDPVAALEVVEQASTSKGYLPDYQRIRMKRTQLTIDGFDAPGADWEFTFSTLEGIQRVHDRAFRIDNQCYAIYWQIPVNIWDKGAPWFRTFARTFKPI